MNFTEDYKNFLKEFNGGYPNRRYFQALVPEVEEYAYLGLLFGINLESDFDIMSWTSEYKNDLAPHTFFLGNGYNDGSFLMNERGIYIWDDIGMFDATTDDVNMFWMADTFDEFIALFEYSAPDWI